MRREAAGLLLSDKDLRIVQAALESGRELEVVRSLGALRLRITTRPAGPAWAPYTMLARVERWEESVYSTKWCISAEEVQRYAG